MKVLIIIGSQSDIKIVILIDKFNCTLRFYQMDKRTILLWKLDHLSRCYPNMVIPYYQNHSIDKLKVDYQRELVTVKKYLDKLTIEEASYHFDMSIQMWLEFLHHEINDIDVKHHIQRLQSHIYSIDDISSILEYCNNIDTNHEIQLYLCVSVIYRFISDGPLSQYKDIIIDSIKDQGVLYHLVGDFNDNYDIPTIKEAVSDD